MDMTIAPGEGQDVTGKVKEPWATPPGIVP
jgi:hypothetical protein